MDRMLVVVFENELKAYDGSRALKALDSEGSISVYAEAVIKKNDEGTVTVKQAGDEFPIRTLGGTTIGVLVGLLGGPIGLAVGAVAGTFAGGAWDINRAGVNADFLNDVSAKLTPGKWAIVSEISEDWVTPSIPKWKRSAAQYFALREEVLNMNNTPKMWQLSKRILPS
jgi:uncharacterized membrane protein